MRTFLRLKATSLAIALAVGGVPAVRAHSANAADAVDGRWNASLDHNGTEIPFRLDISGSGTALKGTLYDGFEPYEGTTSATFHDGKLVLNIEHYLTTITATVEDGQLVGNVVMQSRSQATEYGFKATRYAAPAAQTNPRKFARNVTRLLAQGSARVAVMRMVGPVRCIAESSSL